MTTLKRLSILALSCLLPACAFGGDQGDDGFVLSAGGDDEVGETLATDTGATEDGDSGGETTTTTTDGGETTTTTTTTDGGETTTTTTDGGETTTTTGELPELPCDPGFDIIQPNPAIAGQPFTARFTANSPYAWIGMSATQIEGVGNPSSGNEAITDDGPNGPWHWAYSITGHGAGIVELEFTSDMGAMSHGTCQVHVI